MLPCDLALCMLPEHRGQLCKDRMIYVQIIFYKLIYVLKHLLIKTVYQPTCNICNAYKIILSCIVKGKYETMSGNFISKYCDALSNSL